MYRTALACSLLALLAAFVPAADKPLPNRAAAALQDAFTEVYDRAAPSVVCILVSRNEGYKQFASLPSAESPGRLAGFDADRLREEAKKRFDRTREALVNRLDLARPDHVPESSGSGIVVGESGLVLTNYHVVRGATKVYVRLPGGKGSYADIHAADPRSDLAVLKLLTPPKGLKALPLGRGEDVRPAQLVLALTNAFDARFRDTGPAADWGIVSAVRRKMELPRNPAGVPDPSEDRIKTLGHYPTLIQTNAKLNAGCSGGALLNLKGELIGITSALAATADGDAPGGFAVPIDDAVRRIVKVLKEGKEVEYGFLGVNFPPWPPKDGPEGVLISSVMKDSPAERAGLKANHYIVKVNGTPIKTNDDVFLTIGTALAGSTIQVEILSPDSQTRSKHEVRLAKYYVPGPFIASQRPPAVGGLRVDYTSTMIQAGDAGVRVEEGVVTREVLPGSPAAKANIQVGRVITQVNGRAVFSPAEYYEAVSKGTGPLELKFSGNDTVKLDRR
jgi:S1-C subfamily serine protease